MRDWGTIRICTLALTLAAVACSKSDKICGTWDFSHGVIARFDCGGKLEIFDKTGNSRGTARWKRDGQHIEIEGSAQPILGAENHYLVHKLGDNELVLKGTRSSDLLSAVAK
jgi:hypothetical protein